MANGTGPSLNLLQKHLGPSFMAKKRKEDVELPNKSGRKDPRLKTTFDNVKEGYGILKKLGKK